MIWQTNSSFSKLSPRLQLAIDSTSLGEFKTCPRKYQLSIVEGWRAREESVHLTFGIWLHQAREGYEHARVKGLDHEEALDRVLDFVLKVTWNRELGRPWISGHDQKNRQTLIQTTVWYLDAKGRDDPLETIILSNGKPAVELSFRFDSQIRTSEGEVVLLCGHLDRLARLNDFAYVPDIKTSKSDVTSPAWLKQWSPSNQFSIYSIAGQVAFDIKVEGVMVDGVQVGVTFARFHRAFVPRSQETLSEWLKDFGMWYEQMEEFAAADHWPMNDKACDMYGGCVFREICTRSPSSRPQWLRKDFHQRVWDPLQIRGEA